jgi:hypothetical protein
MRGVLDHLWQSILFVALVFGLARLTRNNLAALRLWMWRSAALKFLLPFGLLYAFGAWLGFPVRHSAIPPPAAITDFVAFGLPLATPAQTFAGNAWWVAMGPAVFDPYSLRQPVTDYLYQRFGVSIRVNGDCQEPCGNYDSFHIERLPRCANPLSSHLCRQ